MNKRVVDRLIDETEAAEERIRELKSELAVLEIEAGIDWFRVGVAYQTYDWELREQLKDRHFSERLREILPRWAERRLVHGIFRLKLGWVWGYWFVPDLYLGRLKEQRTEAEDMENVERLLDEREAELDGLGEDESVGWEAARRRGAEAVRAGPGEPSDEFGNFCDVIEPGVEIRRLDEESFDNPRKRADG